MNAGEANLYAEVTGKLHSAVVITKTEEQLVSALFKARQRVTELEETGRTQRKKIIDLNREVRTLEGEDPDEN